MRAVLRKVNWNKGQTDNGVSYDYTRVYIESSISESSENEFGFDLIQCEYGDESKKVDLLGLKGKLPVLVDIELVPEIKGKRVFQRVVSLRVVDQK